MSLFNAYKHTYAQDSFLFRVVEKLLQTYGSDLSALALVLPSRRSCLYIKKYIAEALKTEVKLPEILSSDDFIRSLSNVDIGHEARLLLELFNSYHATAVSNSNNPYKNFEDFTAFGLAVLNDFDLIDLTLPNEKATLELFEYLGHADELSRWSKDIAPEQHDRVRRNKRVSAYLDSWQHLQRTYLDFRSKLKSQNKAYKGMLYRQISRDILNIADHWHYQKIIFIGLSQLYDNELLMIRKLAENQLADVFVDADDFYMNQVPIHEAGLFLRHLRQSLGSAKLHFIEKHFQTKEKDIEILASTNNVLQAKYVGNYLKELFDSLSQNGQLESFKKQLNHTVIILPEEQLLAPVLAALPDLPEGYTAADFINITMGVPLSQSPLADLVESIFTMQGRLMESVAGDKTVFFKDIQRLMQHPYIFDPQENQSEDSPLKKLQEEGLIYMTLEQLFRAGSLYQMLFEPWQKSTEKAFSFFEKLTEHLYKRFKEQAKTDSHHEVQLEYIFHFHTLLRRVSQVIQAGQINIKIAGLKRLIQDFMRETRLSFAGEPLKPIQIMGFLESRNLDFENVIVLSCNERVFPRARSLNSVIPYEIRLERQIPTHEQSDAALAYLFYRLLHRAKNIKLIYRRGRFNEDVPEKSRFLLQIEHEWANFHHIRLRHSRLNLELPQSLWEQKSMAKSPEVIQGIVNYLEKKGLSASTLAQYLTSPLDFYRQRVLDIKPPLEVESDLSDIAFGVIMHYVLEKVYEPYRGKWLEKSDFKEISKHTTEEWLEATIREAAQEKKIKVDFDKGSNFLIREGIKQRIVRYLEAEVKLNEDGQDNFKPFMVLGTERRFHTTCEIEVDGLPQKIRLEGALDRLDCVRNEAGQHYLRIVDYKSGAVPDDFKRAEVKHQKSTEPDKETKQKSAAICEPVGTLIKMLLTKEKQREKLLQMLFYEYMVEQYRDELGYEKLTYTHIESGFWFLNSLDSGFVRYDPNLSASFANNQEAFLAVLEVLVGQHLLGADVPIAETFDTTLIEKL